ncbi:hypothetical protein BN159_0428 [Streptomyces davaonensis JCM 4913]|uniref:Cupin 2 conserved barrel domain-containing protein n=1 Tax=Streptomyces davaonensis (strain DSM 101723 / JCM 4913 / KCC S-0913 / 768) TaxID=1214101 RepID=K4QV85_STRDJ|nr:hypothetical protein BN159_0428 [Streptomyces davaonensis JCM 4913]
MTFELPLPDKNDPVWTSAHGFVVRKDGGVVRLTGHETFAVKVTGEQTDGALAFMDGLIEPDHGNVPHIHTKEDEAFYVVSGEFEFLNGSERIWAGRRADARLAPPGGGSPGGVVVWEVIGRVPAGEVWDRRGCGAGGGRRGLRSPSPGGSRAWR